MARGRRVAAPLPLEICGEFARVPLKNGGVALIDASDSAFVGRWCWQWKMSRTHKYVVRNRLKADGPGARHIVLHRELLGAGPAVWGDHRDGDGLNCRRANLRISTPGQNQKNKRARGGRLLPKGVYASGRRFRSAIMSDGVTHGLGTFATAIDAHAAYVAAARRLHGEFANSG